MGLLLTLFWIVIISLFAVLGAYYVRRYGRPDAVVGLYVTLTLFANLTASKTVSFNLGFTEIFAPAAVLIFAVTFLLTDIVNEKFGRGETQKMIAIALGCQLAIAIFSFLILKAAPAPFFLNQGAFESVFGNTARIVAASLIAFFVSENADAHLFAWLKKLTAGRHLWARNAFSSIPAMVLDSTIFIAIAFWGIMPVTSLIIGQSIIKWLVAVIDIPFMYLARKILKEN